MLQDILRDQAVVLRSMADELDSVADVMQRQATLPAQPIDNKFASYEPIHVRIDEEDLPGDMTIAVPDGRIDVTYNMDTSSSSRINFEASLVRARHEARQGKVVKLDFGVGNEPIFLTKENWDQRV